MSLDFNPPRDGFRALAQEANLVAVSAELVADTETPIAAFSKLGGDGYSFLLESAETTDQVGRYSFLGSDPCLIFEADDTEIRVTENGRTETKPVTADPLKDLEVIMSRYRVAPGGLQYPFKGGAVGYLSYDAVKHFEPSVPKHPNDDLKLPNMLFMVARSVIIFDHKMRRIHVLVNAQIGTEGADAAYDQACREIEAIVRKLDQPAHLPILKARLSPHRPEMRSNTTEEEFKGMVLAAQEYIRAGDVFQVVISQRFEAPYNGDPISLYRALRYVNPSPYMFCLRFGNRFSLVGSSPEVHVKAVDGKVEIRPIAGTRKRGVTEEEDDANAAELIADPKERAEHIMLVDLARNDVGRIAEYESVKVNELMIIERFSHVMHITSNVIGALRPGRNAYDVMRATFPAGTVSGSPKVRAMQIINELEKSKRCAYAGAVGYFGFDGNLDSCITLRTVLLNGGKAFVQAGAGLVVDSTPDGEFQETVNKAMGMMRAIQLASEESATSEARS